MMWPIIHAQKAPLTPLRQPSSSREKVTQGDPQVITEMEMDDILLVNTLPQHAIIAGEMEKFEFRLLMELARISNPRIIRALEAYFVEGMSRDEIVFKYGVSASYLSQRLKMASRVYQLVGALIPYYAGRYTE